MNALWDAGCTFLEDVYDAERGMFPYTTRIAGGGYVSGFDHPAAARYTINCLLALRRADELEHGRHPFPARWRELTAAFLARNPAGLCNPGDRGLFLALVADEEGSGSELGDARHRSLQGLRHTVESGEARGLSLQEVCWITWGMTAAARAGVAEASATVERLTSLLLSEFLDAESAIPRHSLTGLRRATVSFGGVAYFLRALHEVASWSGEERVEAAFRRTLERVLAVQSEDGAWPWFYDARSGRVIDRYAVYSVHQDSMSMLFLLPALDRGLDVRRAIDRSYAWVLGANELGTSMIVREPFLRYRSIERAGPFQRGRRYGRSLAVRVGLGRPSAQPAGRVRTNTECRSYELGWVVFVWSGRRERLALTLGDHAVDFPEAG